MAWNVYDATKLPEQAGSITLSDATTGTFTTKGTVTGYTAPATPFSQATAETVLFSTGTSSASAGNRYQLQYSPAIPNLTTTPYPKYFTFFVRAQATSSAPRMLELEGNFGDVDQSARAKLVIYNNKITLEGGNSSDTPATSQPSIDHNMDTTTAFNVYQVSVYLASSTTGIVNVYVNGNATPVIQSNGGAVGKLRAAFSLTDNSVTMGDSSTSTSSTTGGWYNGFVDWILWTTHACTAGQPCTPADFVGKLPASAQNATGY